MQLGNEGGQAIVDNVTGDLHQSTQNTQTVNTEEAIERNVSEYNISHASNSENTNPTNEAVSAKFKSPRKDTYDSLAYFDTVDTTDKAKREFTEKEIDALRKEKRRHAIEAESIEREDVLDITHLLVALGIPFMYAPMEAEAQCSYMINCGLVDAVISDDSDVLIFGGTSVYRNAFKKGKRIQRYTLSLIKDVLGIDRMKLIEFAYLFGGDYTEGIYGIGAATAREIIGGWNGHGVEKLKKFQEWHRSIIKAGSANASPNNEPNAPLDAKLVRRAKV